MKPPPFRYYAPDSVGQAVGLLHEHGTDAKLLAGGQSLIPMMKLRLARPSVLVDLTRIRALDYVRESDGGLAFGALARLHELEAERVTRACPILSAAARHIGHTAIRNQGTVGGSLAHADPAAELPVLALVLGAELEAVGPAGARRIPAQDFFVSYFTTALRPDEVLTETRIPAVPANVGWAFLELSRRSGDFALVAVAALLERDGAGRITRPRIAIGAVAERALRCPEAEARLEGQRPDAGAFRAAGAAAAGPLDPPSDIHASGAYRKHVTGVLVERALTLAWSRTHDD